MAENSELSEKQKLKVIIENTIQNMEISAYNAIQIQAISRALKSTKVDKPSKVYVVTRKTSAGMYFDTLM
jgi:hypothetical protein